MIVSTIWRFQCDPATDAVDPEVQVFVRETTEVEGKTFTDNSMEPVVVLLSELAAAYAAGTIGTMTYEAKVKREAAKASQMEAMKNEKDRPG